MFKQTVNLKDKMNRASNSDARFQRAAEAPKTIFKKKKLARKVLQTPELARNRPPAAKVMEGKHDIDELFDADREEKNSSFANANIKRDLHKIDRPVLREQQEGDNIYKKISLILFILLIGLFAYFLFLTDKNKRNTAEEIIVPAWYAVKLVTGEIYYGEIGDTGADPVVVEKVYYDYDQLNGKDVSGGEGETGNLRLVKRGKETHGPEGTMNIVRSQVLFMEPLKEESKVLKAILNYEK
ncbi:hypothetical protein A2331_07095 [Candidatus Falkowbacteria bacterium RIFOXYB2_FULL_34_18]|uniref:Uncharacterized protein n=1 Tax=Candidatus Falkowbacteria bacterium RIFOXYD2_FULL_34_120 TaxID=1798007 RepID=A0A1F5TRI0_9BACT|nr:MAG: hypothetical protein A2331_07095 [Candidatus Falkowbacteria bacterium RIFOXYB2_FULL_34_18]OGF29915.1 MAG: hypothetical protein A2500_03580 [Candidatus Falkowbacteria bacterium RIFOXYC12_FULL_34_55]OGF37227.1 MAG: hypothetical protein A2466_02935 [Candidatus Falkowbacteria bacterium RIFOXYC2_FULL_34_220]OGF39453.1 MAG: hypothetical protein A2515_03955 [Candidatus Falkowbacteria bacterium RIFOXYD12_FULL_34_57]OGF41565.1 MAG: hypothetical protein A2531_02650 [Candidatus Falkowbacteria bact